MNTGQYYDHTTYPSTGAPGSSASLRAELDLIESGFNKLPGLTGNANKLVKVSAGATDMDVSAVYGEDGSGATITGRIVVSAGTIGANGTNQHALPAVASDTFALLAAAQTLTNKTINLTSNTLTGTRAQFNAAMSDGDFASLAGTETLTNKTINLTSNTLTGTLAQFNTAVSDADLASLAGTETLTNKTINLTSNTLTGTMAQFNTALSNGDFAFLATSVQKTSDTGSAIAPAGTTAERDGTPVFGYFRANNSLTRMEWWNGTSWVEMGGGATGTGTDKIFNLNGQTVTASYSIPSGQNAMTAGPITINDGVTVTVPDGSTWTVV